MDVCMEHTRSAARTRLFACSYVVCANFIFRPYKWLYVIRSFTVLFLRISRNYTRKSAPKWTKLYSVGWFVQPVGVTYVLHFSLFQYEWVVFRDEWVALARNSDRVVDRDTYTISKKSRIMWTDTHWWANHSATLFEIVTSSATCTYSTPVHMICG